MVNIRGTGFGKRPLGKKESTVKGRLKVKCLDFTALKTLNNVLKTRSDISIKSFVAIQNPKLSD